VAVDLITVGSFVVGATVRLPRVPYPGETLVGDMFDLGPGGKGSNLAVTAARQGTRTGIVARIGDDTFTRLALDLYEREGIDHTYVKITPAEQTAIGLVYLQESGENTIGLYRGANWLLSAEDVQEAFAGLGPARLVATQLEIPDEAVGAAVSLGRRNGMTVILNPAPARPVPQEILREVDILTPNEGEARLLAGEDPTASDPPVEEIGRTLLATGAGCVVITRGREGAVLFRKTDSPRHIPTFQVEPRDSVGAGDAFNGGLAAALCEGLSLDDALVRAAATGALSTTGIGATGGLPDRERVLGFIASGVRR